MARRVKKVKIKKKSKSKTTMIGSKNITHTQTVKISLGGGRGRGGGGGELDSFYKSQQGAMGGPGSGSSPSYPSSPSYYRLMGPTQTFAQAPDSLSGRNQAVPNNLVSQTLIRPTHGERGAALGPSSVSRPYVPRESLLSRSYAQMSQRVVPSDPEPNRPISAVQSEMVAGRPILTDPTLPRQNPTGRDNYVAPYDGEVGAPDSGYFPQQGQAPISVAEEQALQREVGQTKMPAVRRPRTGTKKPVQEEEEEEEEEDSRVPEEKRPEKVVRTKYSVEDQMRNMEGYSTQQVRLMTKDELRALAPRVGVPIKEGQRSKRQDELINQIIQRMGRMRESASSSASSGAF